MSAINHSSNSPKEVPFHDWGVAGKWQWEEDVTFKSHTSQPKPRFASTTKGEKAKQNKTKLGGEGELGSDKSDHWARGLWPEGCQPRLQKTISSALITKSTTMLNSKNKTTRQPVTISNISQSFCSQWPAPKPVQRDKNSMYPFSSEKLTQL